MPGLDKQEVEDVIIGCAMPEAEQGMNVARIASLRAGLAVESAAMTINRFCSSGLQSIALAGGADPRRRRRRHRGGRHRIDVVRADGRQQVSINPWLIEHYPGLVPVDGADRRARGASITGSRARRRTSSRYESHQKALAAQAAGKFDDEIVPVTGHVRRRPTRNRKPKKTEIEFKVDEGPRADTSLEALAKLKPGVPRQGHGDRRQLVADVRRRGRGGGDVGGARAGARTAAAGALRRLRLRRLPAGGDGDRAGVRDPEGAEAGGLTLDEIDVIELNEAFAAQSLAVIKELGLDPAKVNVNGGAIALGHPLGCTGRQADGHALQEMKRRNAQVRHGDDVRRRRHGRRRDLRESELEEQAHGNNAQRRSTAKRVKGGSFLIEERRPAGHLHAGRLHRRTPADRQDRRRLHHQRSDAARPPRSRPRTSMSPAACCARPASWA